MGSISLHTPCWTSPVLGTARNSKDLKFQGWVAQPGAKQGQDPHECWRLFSPKHSAACTLEDAFIQRQRTKKHKN